MDRSRIPTVRLGDFAAGGEVQHRFVKGLGLGLEWFGFVFVLDHGIDPELLIRARSEAERFFALPEAHKQRYETPDDGRQRGYTSFGVEHAKDRQVADLKEFWHTGRTLPDDHPAMASGDLSRNRTVDEVPEFSEVTATLFDAMDRFATQLLRALELHLGRPEGTFEDLTRDGDSVLRITHYPPLPEVVPEGAVRDAPHEDINLLTIMPAGAEPGLQIQTRDDQWLEVGPPPGSMVCNTGDMMQLLTEGRLPSTTYRVVNPDAPVGEVGSRISTTFYGHPRPEAVLRPKSEQGPQITAREFLMQRLQQIGVA